MKYQDPSNYYDPGSMPNHQKRNRPLIPVLVTILSILVVGLAAFFLVQTHSAHATTASNIDPTETITKLETSLNDLDVDAILDCFTAETQSSVEDTLDEIGSAYGINLKTLGNFSGLLSIIGFKPEFELTVNDVSYISNTECTVNTTFDASISGDTISETTDLTLVLENGQWLIATEVDLDEFI